MKLTNGTTLNTPEEVHEGAVNYFHHFLSNHCDKECPDLSQIISKVITKDDNTQIMAMPSELELKEAIQSIPIDSAPGPNSFGLGFCLSCWEILKDDPLEAIIDFFLGAPLPWFFTTSFIVLIPTVVTPTRFDQF